MIKIKIKSEEELKEFAIGALHHLANLSHWTAKADTDRCADHTSAMRRWLKKTKNFLDKNGVEKSERSDCIKVERTENNND